MSMASSSSIIIGQKSSGLYLKPCTRSPAFLSWNPISRLAVSKCKNDEMGFWGNKTRLQYDNRTKRCVKKNIFSENGNRFQVICLSVLFFFLHFRSSFAAYANTVPGAPLPSGPPPSHPMSVEFHLMHRKSGFFFFP